MPSAWIGELECALPADVILSYQFALCGPGGIDPRVRVDMGSWVRLVEEARPDACNPLRLVNGRGHAASIFVGPDAQMSWPGGDVDAPSMRATRTSEIGPPKGMSETASADDAASPASASGISTPSDESRMTLTYTSA